MEMIVADAENRSYGRWQRWRPVMKGETEAVVRDVATSGGRVTNNDQIGWTSNRQAAVH